MSSYEEIMRAINPRFAPTEEQRTVIEAEGPAILVVAGAGSGKTATMANRIAYHVARGYVRPDEVLGLTFTRKAAGELASRVESALAAIRRAGLMPDLNEGGRSPRSVLARATISTYNAFASDIAQTHGMLVGADPSSRLITEAERWQIMSEVAEATPIDSGSAGLVSRDRIIEVSLVLAAGLIDNGLTIDRAREFFRQEAAAFGRLESDSQRFSDMREVSKDWSKVKQTTFGLQLACLPVVEAYFERKRSEGIVEFADQVAIATRLVEEYPEIGRDIAGRYRLVLLDEYQDTSVNQAEFLTMILAPTGRPVDDARKAPEGSPGRSVCAVGDPNQAIYGWRGASANALGDFARRFAERMGRTQRLSLSTSFRSDCAILDAANTVASGLRTEGVEVGKLVARKGAGTGRVVEIRTDAREDSYRAIAWRIRDVMAEASKRGREPEIAVLCRKRSYVDAMTEALREIGLPYEVVGGESLVMRPEILTARAALGVVVNPSRNDLLLRLLTLWGLGAPDLRALHSWSVELARRQSEETGLDPRGEASLVEALAELPEDGRFTVSAQTRLTTLGTILERLRELVHLPLAELVAHCFSLLGVDVAAVFSQRVKTSIDAFIALGGEYQSQHPGAGLAEFVVWLDLVDRHEHGGEGEAGVDELPAEEVEVHPGVVQIMTIHAAKGLEWRDLVAVPELVEGQFATKESRLSSWVRDASVFPFPLRKDAAYLPAFRASEHDDKIEAGQAYHRFLREDLPYHENQETRRLAYVAFTRPTEELLLAGYAQREGRETARSTFLEEIRCGVSVTPVADVATSDWPVDLTGLSPSDRGFESPGNSAGPSTDGAPNPPGIGVSLFRGVANQEGISTGDAARPGQNQSTSERRAEGGSVGSDYSGHPSWPSDVVRSPSVVRSVEPGNLARAVRMLVDERLDENRSRIAGRPYLTATEVVHLVDDLEAFVAQQRRPIPSRPSRAARMGTALHARIAEFYERPATLDVDAVLDAAEQSVDQDVVTRREEDLLLRNFESSRWARLSPIAVEESLTVVIGGRIVRCVIDAVFDTGGEPDLPDITIVDWKTGRHPNEENLASRELQLAIYRLAWAKTHDVPLESIGSCFVYLREGGRMLLARDLEEERIAARLRELDRRIGELNR